VPYVRGTFRVILKSDVRAGTAQVEAGISDEFYYGRAEIKINIVELGFIEFEKVEPRTIGTQGSGKEVATVSVKVRDTNNEPFPQGTRVHFSLTNPIGGASITTSEAVTNDQGIASTQVKSGRLVGAVTVKAQVTFNAPPSANCPASCSTDEHCNQCGYKCHLGVCKKILEAISPSIAIVGGRPSYRGLTFYCGDRNIGALHGRIGSNIVSSINTECTVILADRFSNKVGVSTQVLFMAEGGAIDASSATKDFLGGGGGGATGDVGVAKASIRSQNPEPADVPPMSVENVNNCQDSQCTQPKPGGFWIPYNCTNKLTDKLLYVEPWYTDEFGRVRNPRDGLITVIAYTNGEEQFTDLNNNGIYDEGEPFVDLGEPFIDINDNGKWDAWLPGYPNGEPFIDMPCTAEQVTKKLNGCTQVGVGNGKWDGPNGKWDADTLIWKKTWILWTGCATMMGNRTINGAVDLRSCTHIPFQSGIYMAPGLLSPTPANLNQFTQSGTFVVDPAKPATVKLLWHDENLNPVIPSATGSYTADGVKMTQSPSTNDLNRNTTGFSFEAHTRLLSPQGSIFQEELEIIPTSFWGVNPGRLFSHLLFLEDSDGKKADDPANADVKIQLQIGTPPIGCTVSATIMGLSY
jgi:hypothetical protein